MILASYNGERYIKDQIISICKQLGDEDELIISDDGSKDNTASIVEELKKSYPMVKMIYGPGKGVCRNFFSAIAEAQGDIIYFSDQDDIWLSEKVLKINEIFKNESIAVVLHNGERFGDTQGCHRKLINGYVPGVLNNIIKSSYWGCCMAFRKEFIIDKINLEFDGVAHDQLIGLVGEKYKTSFFLDEILIMHRIHECNVTRSRSLLRRVTFRIKLIYQFLNYIK